MEEAALIEKEIENMKRERLGGFTNQGFLADCTVVAGEGKEYKGHRVVLAAASGYWYREMRTGEVKDKYLVPEPILPKYTSIIRPADVFHTVLSYMYSDQDPTVLSEEALNKTTALMLFALAHVLEIHSLVELIGSYIAHTLLNDSNAPEILYEGLKYQSAVLTEAALQRTAMNFGDLVRGGKGLEALVALPLDIVKECLERSDLSTPSEGTVFGFVCSYIQKREGLPPPSPSLPSPSLPPAPSDPPKAPSDPPKAPSDPPKAPSDPPIAPSDPPKAPSDPSHPLSLHQLAEERLSPRFLSNEEKLNLFNCVRYPYLSHSELLQAASNPLVAVAKDLVLEGLSVQLSARSGVQAPEYRYRVNRTARSSYSKKSLLSDPKASTDQFLSDRAGFISEHTDEPVEYPPDPSDLPSHYSPPQDWQEEHRDVPMRQTLPRPVSPPETRKEMYRTIQPYRRTQPEIREMTPPRPPQRWPKHSKYSIEPQTRASPTSVREFVYQFDFDDNGVLFFLGSLGKTRAWENPHLINQVKAFASSVGAGRVEDLVGRSVTLLRTDDEEGSYFGVDLGPGRLLLPTAYTIRNRNATSHVMLNWQMEGSRDRTEWVVLDRRMYFTKDPQIDGPLDMEREALKQKGATSTWGISRDRCKTSDGEVGFRYLRIVQIEKNSSGSYNLGLSGLEIYGIVVAGRWP